MVHQPSNHYVKFLCQITIFWFRTDTNWLVVSTLLKNMKVSWDDDIPNIWKNRKCIKMFQTTNQPTLLVVMSRNSGVSFSASYGFEVTGHSCDTKPRSRGRHGAFIVSLFDTMLWDTMDVAFIVSLFDTMLWDTMDVMGYLYDIMGYY